MNILIVKLWGLELMTSVKCHVSYLGLLCSDAVDSETPFDIIDQAEMLTSLLNADHIWINRAK